MTHYQQTLHAKCRRLPPRGGIPTWFALPGNTDSALPGKAVKPGTAVLAQLRQHTA
jgi:hypothetical protein